VSIGDPRDSGALVTASERVLPKLLMDRLSQGALIGLFFFALVGALSFSIFCQWSGH
jgi:hypothetical protein